MIVYGLTFVLSCCALLFEFLIARAVSLRVMDNAVWYALAVGIFIAGMGLGAWLAGQRSCSAEKSWRRLFRLEISMALLGGLSVFLVEGAGLGAQFLMAQGNSIWGGALFFGMALLVSLLVGIGAGMELPLLWGLADASEGSHEGRRISGVLLADYSGALAAGFIFPLVIVPWVDPLLAAGFVGLVNALAAGWLVLTRRVAGGRVLLALLFFVLAFFFTAAPRLETYFIEKRYFTFSDGISFHDFFSPSKHHGKLERERSVYQTIDVIQVEDMGAEAQGLAQAYITAARSLPKTLEGSVFFINGDFQFATNFERIYHEAFVHVPIAAVGNVPERVLVLGAGDGMLVRELLRYPGIKEIVLVDIDQAILTMFSQGDWGILNDQALRDPRVRVLAADAYQFVRRNKDLYDMIFCDFPAPTDFDLAKLYSREFYAAARLSLKSEGVLVADAPGLAEESDDGAFLGDPVFSPTWGIMNATLANAGFQSIVPFFSRLEESQSAALHAVQGDVGLLAGYLLSLRTGFIMAAAGERVFAGKTLLVPEAAVMNDARLLLSLSEVGRFPLSQRGPVNSVFQPVFPLREERWDLRSAF